MYVRECDMDDLGQERSVDFRRKCFNLKSDATAQGPKTKLTPVMALEALRLSRDKWALIAREGPEAVCIGADVCGLCAVYNCSRTSFNCTGCPLNTSDWRRCGDSGHPYYNFFKAKERTETMAHAQVILDRIDGAIYELKDKHPELV